LRGGYAETRIGQWFFMSAYFVLKDNHQRNKPFLALRKKENFLWFERTTEVYIKRFPFLVIEGGRGTGKTKQLKKLSGWSSQLWGTEAVYIDCAEALSSWYFRAGLTKEDLKGLTQPEKNELLIDTLAGKVVLLDNLETVNSKVKIHLVREIIYNASAGVIATENLKKVDPSIIQTIKRKNSTKTLEPIHFGTTEEEVKDVSIIAGAVLILGVALLYGAWWVIPVAVSLRLLAREGQK